MILLYACSLGFLKIKMNTITAMQPRMHKGGIKPPMPLSSSASVVCSSAGLVVTEGLGAWVLGVVCAGAGLLENM